MPVFFLKKMPPNDWTRVCHNTEDHNQSLHLPESLKLYKWLRHRILRATRDTPEFTLNVRLSVVGPATNYTKEFLVFISPTCKIPEYVLPSHSSFAVH